MLYTINFIIIFSIISHFFLCSHIFCLLTCVKIICISNNSNKGIQSDSSGILFPILRLLWSKQLYHRPFITLLSIILTPLLFINHHLNALNVMHLLILTTLFTQENNIIPVVSVNASISCQTTTLKISNRCQKN